MNFVSWRTNDFCLLIFFWIPKPLHLWGLHRYYCTLEVSFFNYFCRILGSIKMKSDQVLVWLKIKISNLSQPLQTSSRPLHDFDKMRILCDVLICSWWRLIFSILHLRKWKTNKQKKLTHQNFGLIVFCGEIIMDMDVGPSPSNHEK